MTAPPALFVFGTLRYRPVLEAVLGHAAVRAIPAVLPGHLARHAGTHDFPILCAEADAAAEGLILADLTAQDQKRLDYYERGFGYGLRPGEAQTERGPVPVQIYVPDAANWAPGAPWDLDAWAKRFGPMTARAAAAFMTGFGVTSATEMARRFPAIRRQADAGLRAARTAPAVVLRRGPAGRAVEVKERRTPYAGFLEIAEEDLSFPRFDGTQSNVVTRLAMLGGDAATVLPYDPALDRVLVIEQFRFGAHMRGDPVPWCLEPIAGRIDPGESPREAVMREAREEAGLAFSELWPVAGYYPSPGVFSEYIYSFVGRADLSDSAPRQGGAAEENEDILGHVIGFDVLMDAVASGEADNGPLVLTALWLAANRVRLRGLA